MKRIFGKAGIFVFITIFAPSCELFDDCKTCSMVTYVDGIFESKTPGILYCGEELAEKEDAEPVTIGDRTTQWECY